MATQRWRLRLHVAAVALGVTLLGVVGCGKDDEAKAAAEAAAKASAAVEGATDKDDPDKDDPDKSKDKAEEPSDDNGEEVAKKGDAKTKAKAKANKDRAKAKKAAAEDPDSDSDDTAADGDEDDADLSPAEKRKRDRQRRIAELRKRNEKQRQERLARLRERREGSVQGEEAGERPPPVGRTKGDGIKRDDEAKEGAEDDPAEAPETPVLATDEGREAPAETSDDDPREGQPPALGPRVAPSSDPPSRDAPDGKTSGRAAPSADGSLNVEKYLPLAEARRITTSKTLADAGSLPGIPGDHVYNSRYYAPPQRSEFGTALQVWKERTTKAALERFRAMKRDYPNVEDTAAITKQGFFSYWNDIMTLAFLDISKKTIVSVSCGQGVCKPQTLFELATFVRTKL